MPGAGRLTVTGKIGPGNTLTATVFTGVTFYRVNCLTNVLTLTCDQGVDIAVDINAATTMTVTITSGVQTITIS